MANVWGFKQQPEFNNRCSRCGEYECVCGDAAVEEWLGARKEQGLGGFTPAPISDIYAPVSDGWTDQRDEDAADQEYCDRAAGRE
jgi:hypothetical protein